MSEYIERLKSMFTDNPYNYISYAIELILFIVVFFAVFKVLKNYKAAKFIPVLVIGLILCGFAFSYSDNITGGVFLIFVALVVVLVFVMYSTEIKRTMLDNTKKIASDKLTVSGVEHIINETIRAIQNMSKNNIGALIVLSNDNLPEGIIESGTVINADINAPMIEAVFYPKAPLHDGAMIVLENKIYAAGCFLPIIQSENLPQDLGSRHRAALGITMVANVTAIVVSEETGIISIVKSGSVYKRYASAADIKNVLSDYYWSDLTAETKGGKE